jgi:hypothetical protein
MAFEVEIVEVPTAEELEHVRELFRSYRDGGLPPPPDAIPQDLSAAAGSSQHGGIIVHGTAAVVVRPRHDCYRFTNGGTCGIRA